MRGSARFVLCHSAIDSQAALARKREAGGRGRVPKGKLGGGT